MADATDPMAAVRFYVDCFNSGDIAAMAATCDVPMSILDGMPPHVWHGPAASQDWYRDMLITGKREMVPQTTSSLWASPGMSSSPATTPTWRFRRPCRSRSAASG